MAIEVKIDKQGRLIIPAEYRKKLNLNEESSVEIVLVADRLILRKKNSLDLKKIERWKEELKSLNLKANMEKNDDLSEKWMSVDYVRNKLGF